MSGEILNRHDIANLPLSVTVKEFWKLVDISCSYGKKMVTYFSDHYGPSLCIDISRIFDQILGS